MNQKNYEYLRDQLLYSGFGESMDSALQKSLKKGQAEFVLHFTRQDEKEQLAAELLFSKSKQSDLYFLNGYQLAITDKTSEQKLSQYFAVQRRNRYTLKEAYNLLHGRAVFKEWTDASEERYFAWIQLDFKTVDLQGNRAFLQYRESYGFDLQAELQRFPLRELQYEDSKHYLLSGLQRGNRQQVTFLLEEGSRLVAIEANPKFKSIAIYDGAMRLEFISDENGRKVSGKANEATNSPHNLDTNESTDQTQLPPTESAPRATKKIQ